LDTTRAPDPVCEEKPMVRYVFKRELVAAATLISLLLLAIML
jgi:hypothetical protein